MIRLIVGLGNPGVEHAKDRHNVGFDFVNLLCEHWQGAWRFDKFCNAYLAEIFCAQQKVCLMKPQTFMNRSGFSVRQYLQFYKLTANEFWVAHDELDLPVGVVRLKLGGGSAGHNGLRDIKAQLGTSEYWRLRIGIGHPGYKDAVHSWVLGKAQAGERRVIDDAIQKAIQQTPLFVSGESAKAITLLHTTPAS